MDEVGKLEALGLMVNFRGMEFITERECGLGGKVGSSWSQG